jgi:hypothetical protein
MTDFWAVLLDETGCEFGAGVKARTRPQAYEKLRENYPESRVVQLESPADRRERERQLEIWAERCYNGEAFDDDY